MALVTAICQKLSLTAAVVLLCLLVAACLVWYYNPDAFKKLFNHIKKTDMPHGQHRFALLAAVVLSSLVLSYCYFPAPDTKAESTVGGDRKSSTIRPEDSQNKIVIPPELSPEVNFEVGSYELSQKDKAKLERYARSWRDTIILHGGIVEIVAVGGADEVSNREVAVALYDDDYVEITIACYINGEFHARRKFNPQSSHRLKNADLAAVRAIQVARVFKGIVGNEFVRISYESHERPDMKSLKYRMGVVRVKAYLKNNLAK
ncbi:MAG: hypothetical protein ACK5LI_07125 [Oleidesulfovibrio sp.]